MQAVHNSRMLEFRAPFGAVKTGGNVSLSIITYASDASGAAPAVALRLWENGAERLIERQSVQNAAGLGIRHVFTAKMPESAGLVWYYFIIDTHEGRSYYGGKSGVGYLSDCEPPSFQITVYDRRFKTPECFSQSVVYQIFPDRFARGREGINMGGVEYHRSLGRTVALHEDWCDEPCYLPAGGRRDYEPNDFFGGSLNGIREKLDYLHDMGVGFIYLNPIFESPSNHRYNTSDYMRIDPILGTEDDFCALVREASERGIGVILDGVFSHTGDDSIYFDRFGRYAGDGAYESRESQYAKWYDFERFPDKYRSWWGFESLPEVNENEPSYMDFIKSVLEKWAGFGISGWRLDVADELPDKFIAFLRREVKRLNPESLLLGEVWEEASDKHGFSGRRKYVDGFELDGVMNYPFRSALMDYLTGKTDAHCFCGALMTQLEAYPEPFMRAQLNVLSTHDTVRAISVLGGAPGRDELTRSEQASFTLSDEALALGKARFLLACMLQVAYTGAPCVYYGDEVGLTGMADPFSRKPFPWGKEDEALRKKVREITRLRASNRALMRGRCAVCAADDDVAAILRVYGESSVLSVVNRSGSAKRVAVTNALFAEGECSGLVDFGGALYIDAFSGKSFRACGGDEKTLFLDIEPLGGLMLISIT